MNRAAIICHLAAVDLTPDQQRAIAARGNVVVVAGAGTGKTRTLVERCMRCLLEERPRVSLDEILVVTFTDAAAADVRQRLRERLELELSRDEQKGAAPEVLLRWHEQLALFETAYIGTLHSFCLQLVRQHFYELELDPQLAVLAEEEAALLADETLEAVLEKHYAGRTAADESVRQLIQTHGRGWDRPIRQLVLRLHHYTQTLPDPAGWFKEQRAMFASPDPKVWEQWLEEGITRWRGHWLPILKAFPADNELAAPCAEALAQLTEAGLQDGPLLAAGSSLGPEGVAAATKKYEAAHLFVAGSKSVPSRGESAEVLDKILTVLQGCPSGKKTAWREPLADFIEETEFLLSLAQMSGSADPLAEDWSWVRTQMTTLLELAQKFSADFTETKRELGMVDFHDLEQYALRLLWDQAANQPSTTARQWRSKLRFVMVDEYQDINAAQDKIIEALSRDVVQANRFLVGDIKQSIYRFRLAQPAIFQGYLEDWRNGRGQVVTLADNFRSREGILNFINSFFSMTMRREVGGVRYDETALLHFGARAERAALSIRSDPAQCVELHLRLRGTANDEEWDEETAQRLMKLNELEDADKEARLVALRLRELKAARHPVWDEDARSFRPVEWRDIAVLLRSRTNKAESYAKEFTRLEVPLHVARGGFYESSEISDLVSLLQLLDNPLQDLPALAVLHSPLAGLTLDELATIRLAAKGTFWSALVKWQEDAKAGKTGPAHHESTGDQASGTLRKVTAFLERFAQWRRLARQTSLSRCVETVLAETHYADWLLTQPRGDQRHANIQRLVRLAQQFDQFQRQSLFRFLRFVAAQQAAHSEPEVAAVSQENAVRLMSIHQSKGLEFPVVVVADLGKRFNMSDLRAEVILDEKYGLCPQVKPPTGKRYPSLPYWLARQRQRRETLGEEMRLLYVAMTRARDLLVLSGAVAESRFRRRWKVNPEASPTAGSEIRSYCDWLGAWFARNIGGPGAQAARSLPPQSVAAQGQNALLRWIIHDETRLLESGAADTSLGAPEVVAADSVQWQQLERRLSWQYRFRSATRLPAKTSVSAVRRRAAERDEEAVEAVFSPKPQASKLKTPAEAGTAHHAFLQMMSLADAGGPEQLKAAARRLQKQGALAAEEIALLDFDGLASFWQSELGRNIRAQAASVRRELPFAVRFSPEELTAFTGEQFEPELADEFVIVQGVVDLAVLLPHELWLVDFKTDAVQPAELAGRAKSYEPQVKLYARALSRVYGRPVSQCWLYFLALRQGVRVAA